jgi:phosphoribosyl-ATP pyrophosphohydrolase
MSLNIAELRRYLNQQKALIIYYEESIETMIKETPQDTEEVIQEGTINKLLDW